MACVTLTDMRLHRSFCCFSLLSVAAGCSGTEREDTDATGAVAGSSGSSNGGSASGAAGTGGAGASGTAGAAAGESGTGVGGAGGGGAGVGGTPNGGSAGTAGSGGSTSTASALGEVLTAKLYASMFPNRNALYGYEALLAAAAAYPELGSVGTLDERRREVAAFFGNAAHETTGGWDAAPGGPEAWGLYFIEEVGCEAGACMQYCDAANERYPCQPGKTYHGRGPIQLSWNFNYGALGEVLGLPLLESPELVTSDGEVAFTTALWFWMTPQPPKPSAHDVMLGRWSPSSADTAAGRTPGFGMTVNIINGGLECGIATDDRVRDRIRFYRHFATLLGTTEGDNLECATMQSY